MIKGVYSIQDAKCGFLSLFCDDNDSCAIRNFQHACANEQSLYYSFGADYTLYRLGTFDTDSGEFTVDTRSALLTGTSNIKNLNVKE